MASDSRLKRRLRTVWHCIARILCTSVVCSLYRVRACGMSNVPKKGPVLVICNHQSFLDPIFSQSWIFRNFYFVARESLFEIKFFGALISSLYTIPVKRGQADVSAVKSIIEKLKQGLPICLYAESSRTSDGKIDDIKPGFSLLSRRSGAKVVPAVIDGAFEAWPRTRKFPKISKVAVSYGRPFSAEQVTELGDKEFARLLTGKLRQMQNELRSKLGKEPFDYSIEKQIS
jgi:1-acyl-sn-glycerol-3-phosphate acyltransferase